MELRAPVDSRAPVGGSRAPVSVATDVRALVDLVADEELEIVDRTVDGRLRDAFARTLATWPVRTGASRRALTFVRSAPLLAWGARGGASYTGAIRVAGENVAETRFRAPIVRALEEAIAVLNAGGDR